MLWLRETRFTREVATSGGKADFRRRGEERRGGDFTGASQVGLFVYKCRGDT